MGSLAPKTSHHDYPPFATDINTAPLVSLSLAKLQSHDPQESTAFFKACKTLGFFYLDCSSSALGESLVEEAEQLLRVQKEFFARPEGEREEFAREKIDAFFGYRYGVVKAGEGEGRRNETYNVCSDSFALQLYFSFADG